MDACFCSMDAALLEATFEGFRHTAIASGRAACAEHEQGGIEDAIGNPDFYYILVRIEDGDTVSLPEGVAECDAQTGMKLVGTFL